MVIVMEGTLSCTRPHYTWYFLKVGIGRLVHAFWIRGKWSTWPKLTRLRYNMIYSHPFNHFIKQLTNTEIRVELYLQYRSPWPDRKAGVFVLTTFSKSFRCVTIVAYSFKFRWSGLCQNQRWQLTRIYNSLNLFESLQSSSQASVLA